MRTPEIHAHQMRLAENDESLCAVYGVQTHSVLSELPYFQNPYCLPPDYMHDVLEKLLPVSVKIVFEGLA